MAKKITEEHIPDSHIVYDNQRLHFIRAYAETKFGKSVICVKVNREQKCFIVIVKDDVPKSHKEEFEKKWTMCKVLTAIA